jgi:hypothetical protein
MPIISSTTVTWTFEGAESPWVPAMFVQIEYMQLKTDVIMFHPQLTQQNVGSTLTLDAGALDRGTPV